MLTGCPCRCDRAVLGCFPWFVAAVCVCAKYPRGVERVWRNVSVFVREARDGLKGSEIAGEALGSFGLLVMKAMMVFLGRFDSLKAGDATIEPPCPQLSREFCLELVTGGTARLNQFYHIWLEKREAVNGFL